MSSIQNAKGTRDSYPEEMILQQRALAVLRKNFEIFGFNPLETPVLEPFAVLASKYTGGAEILKETFSLRDQGNRELGLRYDLTVPFARFVAMNPQLKMPFKRYQVGKVFRDGPIKANRYREFTQCDCDIVGTKSLAADAECVQLFLQVFTAFGLNVVVRVNNRKILDEMMDTLQIADALRAGVILAIDKLDKKSQREVEVEIAALGISLDAVKKLFSVLAWKGNNSDLLQKVEGLVGKESIGLQEMKELLSYCETSQVQFVPSLARGLAYYTGTIFEVYAEDVVSSIGSGGRYDTMIGNLLGGKQEYPAVGCSFGLDVIVNALKEKQKLEEKSVVKLFVVPIGVPLEKLWKSVTQLRASGLATDVYFAGKSVSKALDFANAYKLPYVAFAGEDELQKGKLKLKDMRSGKEELLSVQEIVEKLL
ncbi:histidine--tRNA ligase [Candidatus Woesearchaeota archaeon]|nr:histidine--tRNA ligase [Candidatus Woesearchaeota archaeon]